MICIILLFFKNIENPRLRKKLYFRHGASQGSDLSKLGPKWIHTDSNGKKRTVLILRGKTISNNIREYIGRTQLKKMKFFLVSRVRVLLYVIEADEFSYRCLISRNDGPARQSRNESPLFPKNIPSYILAYHSEGKVFSTCGFFHQIEEGLKAAPC